MCNLTCSDATCNDSVGPRGARGKCPRHYKLWRKAQGDAFVTRTPYQGGLTVQDILDRTAAIKPTGDGCRDSRGHFTIGTDGYPKVTIGKRSKRAGRIVLAAKLGRPIDAGMVARLTCGNSWCLASEHLQETNPAKGPCSVDDCNELTEGHGLCSRHWQTWRRHGDPLAAKQTRRTGELTQLLRDAARAETDECIMVTGFKSRPVAALNGRQMNASRAVWIIANGEPPDGLFVLHTCHQGMEGCISIRHLYLGTSADNGRDMAAGGKRKGISTNQGEKAHTAKLTDDKVREIRSRYLSGESQSNLARDFGVSQVAVSCVVRRKTWRHVAE